MKKRKYDECPAFPHVQDYMQIAVLFNIDTPGDYNKYTFAEIHTMVCKDVPSTNPVIFKVQMSYVEHNWHVLIRLTRPEPYCWPFGSKYEEGRGWVHGILNEEEKDQLRKHNKKLVKQIDAGFAKLDVLLQPDSPEPKKWVG